MSITAKNEISKRFIEAIYELIKRKTITSGADILIQMGKPGTSWPNILNGRQSATLEMLEQLTTKFHVRPDYLISGTLPIFSTDVKELALYQLPYGDKQFTPTPSSQLKILTIPIDLKGNELITVVPEFALAGYSEQYADPNYIQDLPIETVPEDLQGRGTIRKFQVYGDSMEPTFFHGDFIYCTYVEINNLNDASQKIRNDYVYVINSKKGLFLKRLYYQIGEDFITLYSDKEKFSSESKYKPFKIELSEINELWYFRRRYTAQVPVPQQPDRELLELKTEMYKTQLAVLEMQRKFKKKGKE